MTRFVRLVRPLQLDLEADPASARSHPWCVLRARKEGRSCDEVGGDSDPEVDATSYNSLIAGGGSEPIKGRLEVR